VALVASHQRYLQQAIWTRELRAYLFGLAGISRARRILEVGCGSGAVLQDTAAEAPAAMVSGLDMSHAALLACRSQSSTRPLSRGDAGALPFADEIFDIVFCHFLLLWVPNPVRAISEMKRVTRRGGCVIAFAEPDYTARVDMPRALANLGRLQTEALRERGAVVDLGAHLAEIFQEGGLSVIESGPLNRPKPATMSRTDCAQEWAVMEADLTGRLPPEELAVWRTRHSDACARGERVLHVPTYFACAQV
jgi:SAM-dependent methyltransferase